ncbi:uncharacterized protein Z519_06129 [Cladophialophora bantiana CBS 173.52]|uniref:Uncharacterized protein n=1 Tax=Cladophialophora bantiana (strain ATCC 10958 / CBS 173.52 / CDC B-1940 / NIH 8579) TaxID=1442370 RepID=A0A0D2I9T0_CLAB1|nr:uncharacterized protein Z519_06129 [Cladophialophora bantiana CBS 173.52]KIW93524.1 hypothetical protein Z519_06129 [Cladophialophora bantiana CBS 173.52]
MRVKNPGSSCSSTSSRSSNKPCPSAASLPFNFGLETSLQHYILNKSGLQKAEPHIVTSIQDCDQSLWDRNSTSDFHILTVSGYATGLGPPLSISTKEFDNLCALWQIPSKLLKKCPTLAADILEYCVEERDVNDGEIVLTPNASEQPRQKSLNILFSNSAAEATFFCLLICDLTGQSGARCLIGSVQDREAEKILSDLEGCTKDTLLDPAIIIGFILANVADQLGVLLNDRHSRDALDIASRLGIMNPGMRNYIAYFGFDGEPDQEYSKLNVDLYSLQYAFSQNYHFNYANMVLVRGLKAIFESYTDEVRSPAVFECVHDILRRLECQKGTVEFWVRVTQNQSPVLFNLINQRDSRLNYSVAQSARQIAAASKRDSSAMKTISILTLIFLPGTFVSAIFSTTIFDFTGPDVGYGKVGKAWWIYLLCCLLLTLITVGVWAGWMVWRLNKATDEEKRWSSCRKDYYEAQLYSQKAPNRPNHEHRDGPAFSYSKSAGGSNWSSAATGNRRASCTSVPKADGFNLPPPSTFPPRLTPLVPTF